MLSNSSVYFKFKLIKGYSILEILITLVILAFGMLGIGALFLMAHKSNNSSYLRQQAIQSGYNIIDRMRANRQEAVNGSYSVSNLTSTSSSVTTPSVDCSSTSCNTKQLATYDSWYWLAKDVSTLPKGTGAINVTTSGNNTVATITVQWDDSVAQRNLGAATQASSVNPNLVQLIIRTLL
ncbi:type IV pilus modification protein PilV (plasmid) [Legionella sp. D16C41]|uniref:type IV pilus modification protein PilV n=1 Tax=Legionella sp. D16C41 TaxID=3402688 RepID=UPI003AF9D774